MTNLERKLQLAISIIIVASLVFVLSSTVFTDRTFDQMNDIFLREGESNFFQEIKVLKDKNEDLKNEITELEETLSKINNQDKALSTIEDEIKKYQKLSGDYSIFGPGFTVIMDGQINTPWIVDLINELFGYGAEAIAINGIRLNNDTLGLEMLPKGQILLNGSILSSPYTIDVIGEFSTLREILELPGGIFDRIQAAVDSVEISIMEKDLIKMD